jgi:2-polyprenyl-3-methyl-5-hydroxy-6-metoxy-1,4-benzoquinol methylase
MRKDLSCYASAPPNSGIKRKEQSMTTEGQSSQYALRGSSEMSSIMQARKAATDAGFVLPYLQPGMSLLDMGCGQGTITVDLAEAVAPGEAVGIDLQEDHLQSARLLAQQRGISNVRYTVADVYEPNLEPESFDVVYANAVLCHLSDPDRAVRVAHRLLKPGGIIALRDVAGGLTTGNDAEAVKRQSELMQASIEATTKSPYGARPGPILNRICREAGFEVLGVSATWIIRTPASYPPPVREAGGVLVGPVRQTILQHGIATEDEMDALLQRAKENWLPDPDAFNAESWFEVVARKP